MLHKYVPRYLYPKSKIRVFFLSFIAIMLGEIQGENKRQQDNKRSEDNKTHESSQTWTVFKTAILEYLL